MGRAVMKAKLVGPKPPATVSKDRDIQKGNKH